MIDSPVVEKWARLRLNSRSIVPRSRIDVALLVGIVALMVGLLVGHERAVQQIAECRRAPTPEAAQFLCPDWLK